MIEFIRYRSQWNLRLMNEDEGDTSRFRGIQLLAKGVQSKVHSAKCFVNAVNFSHCRIENITIAVKGSSEE